MVQQFNPDIQNAVSSFGLPDNLALLAGYGLLDPLFNYINIAPSNALSLANNQSTNAAGVLQQQIASAASTTNAGISAGATIGSQNIASGANVSIANAQIQGDLIRFAAGDRNAAARLEAQLGLDAAQSNQGLQQTILGLLSQTGLRDQLQARAFTRGFADQPGFGGALNGFLKGVQPIAPPQVNFFDTGSAPSASFSPGANPFSGGGGGGASFGGGVQQGAGNYLDILAAIQGATGTFQQNFTPFTPPSPSGHLPGEGNPAIEPNPQTALQQALAAPPHVEGHTRLHGGGEIKKGESAIVGDDRQGRLTPFSELIRNTKNGIEVIPLDNFRGGFAHGTSRPRGNVELGLRNARERKERDRTSSRERTAAFEAANPPRPTSTPAPEPPPLISGGDVSPGDSQGGPLASLGIPSALLGGAVSNPVPAFTPPSGFNTSGITQTGQEILNLPAFQAMLGGRLNGFPGDQTFSLPEFGLNNIPGTAQQASNFAYGALSPLEQADILTLLGIGGLGDPISLLAQMAQFTPGFQPGHQLGTPFQPGALGF